MPDNYDPQGRPLPPDPLPRSEASGRGNNPIEEVQAVEVAGPTAPPYRTSATFAAPPAPAVVVVPQAQNPLLRWVAWLGWMGLMVCVPALIGMSVAFHEYFDTSEGVQEKFVSGDESSQDKVAILKLEGAIMEGDGFVKRQIDRIRKDDKIRAVVLRVNSPGGTISGSDFIFHHLMKLKKDRQIPLVVSMGSLAASGGYYVAMAVGDQPDSIFAETTTTTGSIGVIIPHYDLSGLMERLDIKDDSIATHPRKQLLSMTRTMSDDHRAVLMSYIHQAFGRFKEVVKEGRPKFRADEAALDALATGEIFSAQKALEHGLVDKIGFVEDAVERAAGIAGLDPANVRVVTYKQRENFADVLGLQKTTSTNPWNVAEWVDLTVPQAYYLFTSLPALASSWGETP